MSQLNIWFPFYVNDYMGDTMSLSTLDHGVYFLLICAYYKNGGPLPDNDKTLANIVKLSLSDWSASRSTVAPFFKIIRGKWIHSRADREIERAKSMQDAKRKGAAITNQKRWGPSHSESLSDVQSQSQSHKEGEGKFPPLSGNGKGENNGKVSGIELVAREKELKRVEDALKRLRTNNSGHWTPEGKVELNRLKVRQKELIATLGWSV